MFSFPLHPSDFSGRRPGERLLPWLPGLWLLLLVSLSLAPWMVKRRLGITGAHHNRGHFLAFFLTAIVFACGAKTLRSSMARLVGAVVLALALEALEMIVFGNAFEWRDVRSDLLGLSGGILAVGLIWASTRIFPRRR